MPSMMDMLKAQTAGNTLNQSWANDRSKFGLKMLQKMGWKEGKGLGKDEQGTSDHIKVKVRPDNLALGANNDLSGNKVWLQGTQDFNDLLKSLNSQLGTSQANKKKKLRKKKRKRADKDTIGGKRRLGSASNAKNLRAKNVRGYSSKDLSIILGINVEGKRDRDTKDEEEEEDDAASSSSSSSSSSEEEEEESDEDEAPPAKKTKETKGSSASAPKKKKKKKKKGGATTSGPGDIKALRKAYKKALKAYKKDEANKKKKRAKTKAKKALKAAEALQAGK